MTGRRLLDSLAVPLCLFLLALGLNSHRLEATGLGNMFTAAAVSSMLANWHNFFFLAFDPAGFLALDKPPLGFWAQALAAWLFGLSGVSLHLPQVLAGSLSAPLMYVLTRPSFGRAGGAAAALTLLFTPVWVATSRTTYVDSTLVFVLLLATLSAITAVRSRRPTLVVAWGVLLGVGFNVKYWQALMVLPALGAYLLFSSWLPPWRRLAVLVVALACLLQLCLAWPVAVDAIPASERPFVANSTDGKVRSLIGMLMRSRMEGTELRAEVGAPGWARLVTPPLAVITGWLFPLALSGLLLAVLGGDREQRREALLWAAWLVPLWFFFSFTRGIIHMTYFSMLVPAIAAGVGMAFGLGAQWARRADGVSLILPALLAGTNLYVMTLWRTSKVLEPMGALPLLALLGAGLLVVAPSLPRWRGSALALALAATLAPPAIFCWLLTCDAELGFPMGQGQRFTTMVSRMGQGDRLVTYLQAQRRGEEFLLATEGTLTAAPVILGTGQAVMALGAYGGTEATMDVPRLQRMIAARKVRFFLLSGRQGFPVQFRTWIEANGRLVPLSDWGPSQIMFCTEPPSRELRLYDCRPEGGGGARLQPGQRTRQVSADPAG